LRKRPGLCLKGGTDSEIEAVIVHDGTIVVNIQ